MFITLCNSNNFLIIGYLKHTRWKTNLMISLKKNIIKVVQKFRQKLYKNHCSLC
jgi:hypothetical protein